MKKVIKWIKDNPLFVVLSMVSVAMLFIDNECGMALAMAATVAPSGSPEASEGIAGGKTQQLGEATTVSNMSEAAGDLIQPEIDEDIVKIASDESIIDTIKRRVKRQVRVNSFEVDHFMIDEKPHSAKSIKSVAGGAQYATVEFAGQEGKLFPEYSTAMVLGVNGYDPTGQKEVEENLMVFCTGVTQNNPQFMAINGPKSSSTDEYCNMPAIPEGSEFVRLAPAAYETQKFIAPDSVNPVPTRLYLQKQLCNSIVSDYFNAQKKRVPFNKAQIAEAVLRQFRLESCRTAWVGQLGKFKVKAMDAAMGYQWDYFSKGIRWQIKRKFDFPAGPVTFKTLIDVAMEKFTTYASSKVGVWLMGKDLMKAIQKIDITLHKDVTMTSSEVFGIACTKLHTVFGDLMLVHDATLDRLGYSKQGAILDVEGLVRYWMKNEDTKTENVEGEEAKRDIMMSIDCLALKGYGHVWTDGSGITE